MGYVLSVGMEGMKGHKVMMEVNVRGEKDACIIIGLPDAPMKESKDRILSYACVGNRYKFEEEYCPSFYTGQAENRDRA